MGGPFIIRTEEAAAIALKQNNPWAVFEQWKAAIIYEKGNMIYWQEDTADRFYYLKKGRVQVFLSSENGGEKTLTILEPGSLFGEAAFFDGLPRVSSARAVVRSEILPVDRGDLTDYFRRQPDLAMEMLRYLARTVRMLSDQVDNMTFLQADQRIARLLCTLAAERGGSVRCTHEEIGNRIGASRVTVSKILSRFARRGWIERRYGIILLLDAQALERFAFSAE